MDLCVIAASCSQGGELELPGRGYRGENPKRKSRRVSRERQLEDRLVEVADFSYERRQRAGQHEGVVQEDWSVTIRVEIAAWD